ncbi:PilN domain-containing protein [Wenzhouxiangella sp. AB-CW3]|uniref:PilN domain-containing protein n=1 Tax=Wenzhouxiangella sp. AB-CW3 TaxID=2771012 RepID=UPI00168C02D2|nr:PilN domain-containing protein [Wenzhouxiangella sp. AB-CW3]QOC23840.1 PilN domain-containing protein [Wenzhouxiangella sp. AB-CW3]
MNQQINLYQPIFRKQKVVFSAQTVLMISIGFLVILLLWSTLVGQRVTRLEAEQERQEAAEQRAVEQLTQLRETMPPTEPDPELVASVERLEQRRRNLRESLTAMEQRMPAAQVELPGRVDALARQTPRGLWLTEIKLGDDGQHMILRGRALAARLVPAYLEGLSEEPLLSGLGFRQVRLHAAEDDMPGISFVIASHAEDDT